MNLLGNLLCEGDCGGACKFTVGLDNLSENR